MISTGIISYMMINLSVAGRMYSVRGILSCNSPNVSYLISYKNYGDQHVGSTTDFKARSRIQKSGIRLRKMGVVLPHISTTNIVIETIHTSSSKYS